MRHYQRYAAQCLLLSEQVSDPSSRAKLLAMAQGWARLAELAEKNARNALIHHPPQQLDRASPRPDASVP
jgi:hypothetical protein